MDPKYLAQIATIVQLGSISKAARRLNITQPSLSRSVKIIESRVGGPILRRGRWGVTPTAIGERLALEGRVILDRSERAKAMIGEWREGLSGELRVGVGPLLEATLFGDFLVDVIKQRPGYSLKVYCAVASQLVDQLNSGELDIVLVPAQLNMHPDQLSQETLFSDRLAVFASREEPLLSADTVTLDDLKNRPWVSSATTSGIFGATRESLMQLGLPDTVTIIEFSGGVIAACRVVNSLQALCVLPLRLGSMLDEGLGVSSLDLSTRLPTRDVAIWTRRSDRDRPEIRDFSAALREFISQAIFVDC